MREMKGLVYRSTGSWYIVKDEQGDFWNARIKGKLKIDKHISSTNPVAVGDVVDVKVLSIDPKKNRIALTMKGLKKPIVG